METEAARRKGLLSLDVELGKMRAPAELEEELEKLYSSADFQFMLVFSLGIPIGLGLGRIRR